MPDIEGYPTIFELTETTRADDPTALRHLLDDMAAVTLQRMENALGSGPEPDLGAASSEASKIEGELLARYQAYPDVLARAYVSFLSGVVATAWRYDREG